jgi:hypothetical protein
MRMPNVFTVKARSSLVGFSSAVWVFSFYVERPNVDLYLQRKWLSASIGFSQHWMYAFLATARRAAVTAVLSFEIRGSNWPRL